MSSSFFLGDVDSELGKAANVAVAGGGGGDEEGGGGGEEGG